MLIFIASVKYHELVIKMMVFAVEIISVQKTAVSCDL